jgi:Rrf2 family protein
MRMSDGVEWAIHCCTVLAVLPDGEALPAARLAEFHEVPPAYLAKHLQALTGAGITRSEPGPRGGFALARPAAAVSLLDIVLAVDGSETAFRCTEIRQRGPAASVAPGAYRRPCGIARAMWRAEDAWRRELAATSVADVLTELVATVAPEQLLAGTEWIQEVQTRRRSRT